MTADLACWQIALRFGLFPQWSAEQVEALAVACETDDPRLCQCHTTFPQYCEPSNLFLPCEKGCPITFGAALGTKRVSVKQAIAAWHATMFENRPAFDGDLWDFICWVDITPRQLMLRELAAECRMYLARQAERTPR